MTKILDGKLLSQALKNNIRTKVEETLALGKRAPCLAVILVGSNPASKVYVGNKSKFAKECLFQTIDISLSEDSSQEEVASAITQLNNNPEVDGILLQLPLPKHLKSEPLLSLIDPSKDADGLHPLNQGLLLRGEGTLRPCTPSGSMLMIDLALSEIELNSETQIESIKNASLAGKNAVVVGRSVLVGKPLALMLLERNATVTIAHSKTENLDQVCRQADILVAAVGKENMIAGSWVKKGAIVIDVGINRKSDGKLCGDIDYASALENASAITPVPGGVGPMTVAFLIKNTFDSYLSRI
jgi:methylenetetrahydrofolate dehydrogenase (NADP+)/methenyltetrahydrofolate cyclohydrolase